MKNRRADLRIVLLAAGKGSRLGGHRPKCLTELKPGGPTIMARQIQAVRGLSAAPVIAVVGFQQEVVRAAHPELEFVVNARYAETNTAVSLLAALDTIPAGDVLWMNGDVVFDAALIPHLLRAPHSSMLVNKAKCGDEEIKYVTDGEGVIAAVSKTVRDGEGEAVGINLVRAGDVERFKVSLRRCGDRDYFERGLELAIAQGLKLYPVDIGERPCIEVDFPEDLQRARTLFA